MKNRHKQLCKWTNFEATKSISDPQLRRILQGLDWENFNSFMCTYFDISIKQTSDNEWIAIDGKELRGSIETQANGQKDKRGTTLLDAVSHEEGYVIAHSFFEGKKDSERTCVYELIEAQLQGRKVSFDALHCVPKTLCFIEAKEGQYLVQVKGNQKELYEDLVKMPDYLTVIYDYKSIDKGHGRIDERNYTCYDISKEYFAPRWAAAKIKTLIRVERKSTSIKTKETTHETSYYIVNQGVSKKEKKKSKELCNVVRQHWSVENQHQIRDVTLNEDHVRTPKGNATKFLAVARSWVINLYRKRKTTNFAQDIQNTNENQNIIFKLLKIK
jgi:predicted transposase YbfD/YdcC